MEDEVWVKQGGFIYWILEQRLGVEGRGGESPQKNGRVRGGCEGLDGVC